jgi:mRNA-degrading endonuclease RelE of RelBE toxin-antitoxin system
MRQLNPQRRPYTVDIAPAAWRQLGAVPGEIFQRIRRELDALAVLTTQRPPPSLETLMDSSPPTALSFFVEHFVAIYEIDDDRRAVTLLEVSQRLPLEE